MNKNQKSRKQKARNGRHPQRRFDAREKREIDELKQKVDAHERSDAKKWRAIDNDPAFYAQDEALLRDAASLPFSWATGAPINLLNQNRTKVTTVKAMVPGIVALTLYNYVGYNQDPTTPLNIGVNAVYRNVRKANSGSTNYDAPDLGLYLIQMADVYSALNWLQRVYGYANLYAQGNRYLPEGLASVENVLFKNITQNLADFRYRINVLINKAATFSVPGGITYFQRKAMLYQSVYIESGSIKDQMYMLKPRGFYRYTLNTDSSGMLKFMTTPNETSATPVDYVSMCDFVNAMLDALIYSEDINVMSGDILKAYGDNTIKLAPMPEDYILIPKQDTAMLEQIENAVCVEPAKLTGTWDIVQSENHGFLTSGVSFSNPIDVDDYAHIDVMSMSKSLNTHGQDTSPAVVMESTRLMCAGIENNGTLVLYGGTEIVGKVSIHYNTITMNGYGTGVSFPTSSYSYSYDEIWNGTSVPVVLARTLAYKSAFDYAPRFMYGEVTFTPVEGELPERKYTTMIIADDLDVYTMLSSNDIDRKSVV